MTTVLVVDDTPVDRRLAGGLIEDPPHLTVSYANHGIDALEKMETSLPDLVVTDLQMPVMGGLELVTRIRMVHPSVPVILMTAQGSETIAMQALEQGAASYVPKAQLSNRLRETVQDVLSAADVDKANADLMACQNRLQVDYSLRSDPNLIDSLISVVQQTLEAMQLFDHTEKCRVVIALREALLNALFRGNLELSSEQVQDAREQMVMDEGQDTVRQRMSQPPYSERMIFVSIDIGRESARFQIRDEGPGFDPGTVLGSDSSTGSMESGRGITLMRSFMDEVHFSESGNQVTLVKNRTTEDSD